MNKPLSDDLEHLFDLFPSTVGRDLKLNFKKIIEGGNLNEAESSLVALAAATSVGLIPLISAARARLTALNFTEDEIQEAAESAAIMGMLNTYYRFRHMLTEETPDLMDQYRNVGLRMTSLAKPHIGKERFEMLAFTVSVLNGCQNCIVAHEKALRDSAVPIEKIHDLARMAAVIKGLRSLVDSKLGGAS